MELLIKGLVKIMKAMKTWKMTSSALKMIKVWKMTTYSPTIMMTWKITSLNMMKITGRNQQIDRIVKIKQKAYCIQDSTQYLSQ